MSKRKPNTNKGQGWQKVELSSKPAAEETSSKIEEASKEATEAESAPKAEETAPDAASEAVSEPADTVTEALPEQKENQTEKEQPSAQKETKNKQPSAPQTDSAKKAAAKKRRRKYSAAVPLGGFFILMALIGVITVAVFGVRATESLIDNSKQKEEFADIILPVLMFDPVPFEDPNEMGELALLRSSIWSAVISNNDKYSIGDGNMVSVPKSDVDVACASLFGSSVTLNHQSFEDYLSLYSFDEETQTYYVPVDANILYTPQVEEISRNGDIFELTVGYLAPDNQWMQSIKGEKSDPTPSKYMIYELKKVEDHYQLVAIKDPPEGAVPGIPQIEETPTPQTTTTTEPQSIEPAQTPTEETEQTEETAPTEQQTEESESAQL